MSAPKIVTRRRPTGSPLHRFDCEAWRETGEPNDPTQFIVGYGHTDEEAINDLILQLAANFGRVAAKLEMQS